jgi:hypothetical protein
MQTKIKKSINDLTEKEVFEDLNTIEEIIWKDFIQKQKNILKEVEKVKPLKSYLTEKEFEEFISLI